MNEDTSASIKIKSKTQMWYFFFVELNQDWIEFNWNLARVTQFTD